MDVFFKRFFLRICMPVHQNPQNSFLLLFFFYSNGQPTLQAWLIQHIQLQLYIDCVVTEYKLRCSRLVRRYTVVSKARSYSTQCVHRMDKFSQAFRRANETNVYAQCMCFSRSHSSVRSMFAVQCATFVRVRIVRQCYRLPTDRHA